MNTSPIRPPGMSPQAAGADARAGLSFGIAAYAWWGLAPLYFKAVAHVSPAEVLAHRIVWSLVLLAVLMRLKGRWPAARVAMTDRRVLLTLLVTTILIAGNWFAFIWAIANHRLLQASLGYFINPLVNVLLGFLLLRERLRRPQVVSVLLAALGVSCITVTRGGLPIIALVLAGTFAAYGLLRKLARVDALVGLTVETMLLLPIALVYLTILAMRGTIAFRSVSATTDLLLALSGIITAVPLLWFTNAVRRLRLTTVGFLQYIAPTLQFTLATAAFGEPISPAELLGFGLIWAGLAVYSLDSLAVARARTAA